MKNIKLGTCVKGEEIITTLSKVIASGFEAIELYYNCGLHGTKECIKIFEGMS